MARYSVVEAKNQLSALIDAVQAGEEVVITRHGKPAAQIVQARTDAADTDPDWPARRDAALARLDAFRATLPRSTVSSVDLIRQMRDEGP